MPILENVKAECQKLGLTPSARKSFEDRLIQNFPALQSGYDRILGFTEDEKGLLKVIKQLIELSTTHKTVAKLKSSDRAIAVRTEGKSLTKEAQEALKLFHKSGMEVIIAEKLPLPQETDSHFFNVDASIPNVHSLLKSVFVGKRTILLTFDVMQAQSHAIAEFIYACKQIIQPRVVIIVKPVPGFGWRYYSDKSWYHHRECDIVYNEQFTAAIWDAIATKNTTILKGVLQQQLQQQRPKSFLSASPGHLTFTFEDEDIKAAGFSPELHRKFLREYYTFNFPGTMSSVRLVYKEGVNILRGELAGLSGYKKAVELKDKSWLELSVKRLELIQVLVLAWGDLTELVDLPGYPKVNSRLWKLARQVSRIFDNKPKRAEVVYLEDSGLLKLSIRQGKKRYYAWLNFSMDVKQLADSILLARLSKSQNLDLLKNKIAIKERKVVMGPYAVVLL